MTDLSIPYNGDINFLNILKKAKKYKIKTVYGKMFQDIVGGGRARYDVANFEEENLQQAIKLTHELGAEFNYLFNGACLANAEFEKESEIVDLIDKLISKYAIDMVTVANPFLLKLIKKHFPKLKVSVSIISRVDSLEKVLKYEEAGADEITLDYNIYRNFTELERIKKNSSIGFQLIVNDGYLFNCPWAIYHFQLEGHDSQTGYNNFLKYFSFCRFNCKQKAAKDPCELIKGMWIRPEDLQYYENIGYTKFKIIDRLKETNWLMNAIDAYHNRSYNNNLSDILCSFDTFEKEVVHTPIIQQDSINLENIQHLKEFWDLKPYIDNKKLTDINFLNFFIENKIDCRNLKCSKCGYCENLAKEVVRIDKSNADNVVNNLDVVKNKMIDLIKSNSGEVKV
jgi:collagenase-like PrtC family protease